MKILAKTLLVGLLSLSVAPSFFTTVGAYSKQLITFSGSGISAGLTTKSAFTISDGDFYADGEYYRTSIKPSYPATPLTVDALYKGKNGYSAVDYVNIYGSYYGAISYAGMKNGTYKLGFHSANWNMYTAKGTVYDKR